MSEFDHKFKLLGSIYRHFIEQPFHRQHIGLLEHEIIGSCQSVLDIGCGIGGIDVVLIDLDLPDSQVGDTFARLQAHAPIRDAKGKVLYGFGLMHDITERKRAEETHS